MDVFTRRKPICLTGNVPDVRCESDIDYSSTATLIIRINSDERCTTQQRGPQGGPRSGKIPRFAATYWKPLRSAGRNGSPAPHLPQINFLVDYIGVLKNQVSRAAKAPAATIVGSTRQQQQASIKGCEGGDDLLGQAPHLVFMG